MAPIKFEEHIKERLEERRIEPSAAGWERLSGQLQIQQGKKKSKRVLWMSIAASFIIGVAITALIFNDGSSVSPELVDTPEKKIEQQLEENFKEKPVLPETITKEEGVATSIIKEEPQKPSTANKKDVVAQKKVLSPAIKQRESLKESTQIVYTQSKKQSQTLQQESINAPNNLVKLSEEILTNKIQEVVAQVEEKELVTDQEIEDLLRDAQRDIVSKQLFAISQEATVNANDLLLDVEYEVDPETFKDKVFKTLKKEFGKALDAVANKNN